ncbi:MAG: DUF3418 domain-containing protein, partial [Acidimicrobiales bacterium]|nr:DUF3418 domain-containing protein [Acidimicrobiales bacterium]
FGELPRTVEVGDAGRSATAYPTVFDEGESVGVRLVASAGEQVDTMWLGIRRLLRMRLRTPARSVRHLFTQDLKLGLAVGPHPSTEAWFEDCVACALDHLIEQTALPWTDSDYRQLASTVDDRATEVIESVVLTTTAILTSNRRLRARMADMATSEVYAPTVADATAQLDRLVYDGFIAGVGLARLADIGRYLDAIEVRLDRVRNDVARDHRALVACRRLEARWGEIVGSIGM